MLNFKERDIDQIKSTNNVFLFHIAMTQFGTFYSEKISTPCRRCENVETLTFVLSVVVNLDLIICIG